MACAVESEISDQLLNITMSEKSKPEMPCIIVLGMAGSGKTTFVQVRTIKFYNDII